MPSLAPELDHGQKGTSMHQPMSKALTVIQTTAHYEVRKNLFSSASEDCVGNCNEKGCPIYTQERVFFNKSNTQISRQRLSFRHSSLGWQEMNWSSQVRPRGRGQDLPQKFPSDLGDMLFIRSSHFISPSRLLPLPFTGAEGHHT